MKSGIWPSSKENAFDLNEKLWAEINKMELLKGIRCYETCISEI
jgi:hypothetical protein